MRRIDCIIFIKIMICPVDIHCLYAFIVTSHHQPWQMSGSSKFNEQKYLHTYIYILIHVHLLYSACPFPAYGSNPESLLTV